MLLSTSATMSDQKTRIHLVNRMLMAIAMQVKKLFVGLFDAVPVEVGGVGLLPVAGTDVLIVGRQHRTEGADGLCLGFSILEEAIQRCNPRVVIYVIPSMFKPDLYRRDMEVLNVVAATTPIYILEFARLSAMRLTDATASARRTLDSNPSQLSKRPELLLPVA